MGIIVVFEKKLLKRFKVVKRLLMNFLAHAYLSFNHSEILIGNMISDFIKGKKKFDYPQSVQNGIALHRQIDEFTDNHAATKEAKVFLKPAVGLYAGAFIDVAYDHFLANDATEFSDDSLQHFAQKTYAVLTDNNNILPAQFQQLLPYMQSQNWLYNYKSISGTEKSFGGVVKRAAYLNSSSEVFDLFKLHYSSIRQCYKAFFPDVKSFAILQIQKLIS